MMSDCLRKINNYVPIFENNVLSAKSSCLSRMVWFYLWFKIETPRILAGLCVGSLMRFGGVIRFSSRFCCSYSDWVIIGKVCDISKFDLYKKMLWLLACEKRLIHSYFMILSRKYVRKYRILSLKRGEKKYSERSSKKKKKKSYYTRNNKY